MKKLFWILMMLIAPSALTAQVAGGSWKTHPTFAASLVKNVVETGNKVYYLSKYDLFCYDKLTGEHIALNKSNGLSDVLVTGLYYNYGKKYLVVTYDDANIDIIADDGKQYNIPGIKNMITNTANTINDVTFAPGKIYVATVFGYAVIDDGKFALNEWHRYNKSLASVAQLGDYIIINGLSDRNLSYCRADALHDRLGQFAQTTTTFYPGKFVPIDDRSFFVCRDGNLSKTTLTENNGVLTTSTVTLVAATPDNVQRTPGGFIANFKAQNYYYTFDATGGNATKVDAAEEIYSANPEGDGSLWSVGADGLHNSKTPTTYHKPEAMYISSIPFWMEYDHNSKLLYLTSTGDNHLLADANKVTDLEINVYDGNTWTDITPTTGMPPTDYRVRGWYWPCIDPNNPSTYFIATRTVVNNISVLRVKDRVVEEDYSPNNSPLVPRKAAIRFDKDGNLWAVNSSNLDVYGSNSTPIKVLPKDKLYLTPSKANWVTMNMDGFASINSFKYNNLIMGKGNDVKVFYSGDHWEPVFIWDNHGDVTDSDTWDRVSYTSLRTNKGVFTWNYFNDNGADNDGNIWLAADMGLVYFDPTKAFDDDFTVTDANALIDGQIPHAIDVDGENRKWIGMKESGVYVINADNTEVLAKFNTANSGLLSNCIYQIKCNPDDNSVFFTTPLGVCEYRIGISPAARNYDNVTAYPNPVKPDFTGLVTITGLMENSNVVITDAAGNVVARLSSANGTLTWDGCSPDGERLPTGNYYVYASQTTPDLAAKPAAKVMIIK